MATSAASKPFTVKGTRWMCTVRFVAFLLRQRGWAWVLIGINASRAVRMAAPRRRRGIVPVRMAAPPQRRGVVPFSRSMRAVVSAADLPGLCGARALAPAEAVLRKPSLELDLKTVADAVGGLEAMDPVLAGISQSNFQTDSFGTTP